jgi:5-(carboxyamino)imidazole ribonucleotide synthase
MRNLIGDDIDEWATLLGDSDAHVHLYGKDEARPGRKMGHVTRVSQASR